MKKTIYLFLTITCLITIFLFSSKSANEPNSTSKNLINQGIIIYEKITNTNIDNKIVVEKINYPVRKVAHFTIFLILGIFIYSFIAETKIDKKVLLSIILCLTCAILDETHQIFSLNRTPQILDIIIDALGSIISISILNKKKGENHEKNIKLHA